MMRLACPMMLAVLLSTSVYGDDKDETQTLSKNVERAVFDVYQPMHRDFARAGKQLLTDVTLQCKSPVQVNVQTIRKQFKVLVYEFSRIEFYRVGPMLENNRKNRLFYWPDKRRVGERQMRALLNSAEAATLSADQLALKSVALQGLTSFERLLSADSSGETFSESGVKCAVLQAIAGNVQGMADSMSQEWLADDGIAQSLIKPMPNSDLFRSEREVLRSLVTQIAVGLDLVLDRKIAPLINTPDASVRAAPLWKIRNTVTMLDGNLEGIRALLLDTGLAQRTGLQAELTFEFRTVSTMLQRLKELPTLTDSADRLTVEAYSLFKSLSAVVGGIRFTVSDRFMESLGVSAGFNSEDGD